jgi:hypothetical protein
VGPSRRRASLTNRRTQRRKEYKRGPRRMCAVQSRDATLVVR